MAARVRRGLVDGGTRATVSGRRRGARGRSGRRGRVRPRLMAQCDEMMYMCRARDREARRAGWPSCAARVVHPAQYYVAGVLVVEPLRALARSLCRLFVMTHTHTHAHDDIRETLSRPHRTHDRTPISLHTHDTPPRKETSCSERHGHVISASQRGRMAPS